VYAQDGARFRGQRGFEQTCVHAVGRRIDVHEDRPRADGNDGVGRGDEAVTDRHHIVAETHAEGA
jgi:hypothetical protein